MCIALNIEQLEALIVKLKNSNEKYICTGCGDFADEGYCACDNDE